MPFFYCKMYYIKKKIPTRSLLLHFIKIYNTKDQLVN